MKKISPTYPEYHLYAEVLFSSTRSKESLKFTYTFQYSVNKSPWLLNKGLGRLYNSDLLPNGRVAPRCPPKTAEVEFEEEVK